MMTYRDRATAWQRSWPVLLSVAVAAGLGLAAPPAQAQPQASSGLGAVEHWRDRQGGARSASAATDTASGLEAVAVWRARQERVGASAVGTAAAAPAKEGSFVSYNGRTFRVVGGALFYVTNWNVYGGRHPVKKLTKAQFNQYVYWAQDGVFVQTAQDHRVYRMVGGAPVYVSTWAAFGNKPQKATLIDKAVLDHAGDFDFPWGWVNDAPLDWWRAKDGRLILDQDLYLFAAQTGRYYKVIGGSPQYLPTWVDFGDKDAQRIIRIDATAVERSGQGGPWSFLRKYPYEGWPVHDQDGRVYMIAGGAPVYVSNPKLEPWLWDGLFPAPLLDVWGHDDTETFPYDHLRYHPRDDTFLVAVTTDGLGGIYHVQDGIPTYVPSWDEYGGPQPFTGVDNAAIQRAGQPFPYDHLNAAQAPG